MPGAPGAMVTGTQGMPGEPWETQLDAGVQPAMPGYA